MALYRRGRLQLFGERGVHFYADMKHHPRRLVKLFWVTGPPVTPDDMTAGRRNCSTKTKFSAVAVAAAISPHHLHVIIKSFAGKLCSAFVRSFAAGGGQSRMDAPANDRYDGPH